MIDQASRFLGTVPENYDRYLGPRLFEGYAADLARRVARLRPSKVLELAAGTGIVTEALHSLLGDDCEIVATDLNEPMLQIARERLAPGGVVFTQVDATDLPFAEGSFDVVVCQFGVMFFPDKARGYTQALKVLKPGGSYLFNVWDSWKKNPFAEIAHSVVEELFPGDPPGFYKVPFHYHDAELIRCDVLSAGFGSVDIEHVATASKISPAADFARGLVFGNPLVEEVLSRGGDPNLVCEAIRGAVEDRLGTEMPLRALIVEAAKT